MSFHTSIPGIHFEMYSENSRQCVRQMLFYRIRPIEITFRMLIVTAYGKYLCYIVIKQMVDLSGCLVKIIVILCLIEA